MEPLTALTRDDLIRSGACADGVDDWREIHAPNATAVPTDDAIGMSDEESLPYILRAANLDGYGYGNGDGYGYGYGNGDGYGYGYDGVG